MKIKLSSHLKFRLKERKIPQNYPGKILSKPDFQFIDAVTSYKIAVKNLKYNFKIRPIVVVYDIIGLSIQVITIHPISSTEMSNKLKRGRWIKNEEN